MANACAPSLTPDELARIGTSLYRGVAYNGRPAWQSWLADGLSVNSATVRRWLMSDAASRRAVPSHVAGFLLAAEGVAGHLALWERPRGTSIAGRMAELIASREGDQATGEEIA